MSASAWLPTADLTSTCPHIEITDHPTILEVTCDQHVDLSASRIWRSKSELPLQMSDYPISHDAELALIPFTGRKSLPHKESKQHLIP